MKKLFVTLALCLSIGSAFAQNIIEATSAVTISPFVTATRLLEATTAAPFLSSLATAIGQSRGVAGKEQLKDELVALNNDMTTGLVRSIEEVRQPALKEFFAEIAADEAQMNNINSLVKSGSELHKIATAVTAALLSE
jgi:hypothetical protein